MRYIVGLEVEVSDKYSGDFVESIIMAGLSYCNNITVIESIIEKK